MLYDCLGKSLIPFVIDADMLKVIQELVDLSYPNTEYEVWASSKIFSIVSVLHFTFFL